MFSLKKLIRVFHVQMLIKECNQFIQQKHKHMEQAIKEDIKDNNVIK